GANNKTMPQSVQEGKHRRLTSQRPERRSSILCADDRTISPAWSRRIARECLGIDPLELPGGHCPHVCRPAALADLLASMMQPRVRCPDRLGSYSFLPAGSFLAGC